jgi:hypothetical protein
MKHLIFSLKHILNYWVKYKETPLIIVIFFKFHHFYWGAAIAIAGPRGPRNLATPLAAATEIVSTSGIHDYESTVTCMRSGGGIQLVFS